MQYFKLLCSKHCFLESVEWENFFILGDKVDTGLKKEAIWVSRTTWFCCRESNLLFSVAQCTRAMQVVCQLNQNKRLAQGKQNLRTAGLKGKLVIKFVF